MPACKTPDITPEEAVSNYMRRRKAKKVEPRQAKGDKVQKKSARARPYQIRFGVVAPEQLSQYAIVWQHPGYSRPPAPQPNNGEHGAKQITPPLDFQQKRDFYNELVRSVGSQGVLNPIFALAYPDGTFVRYGCSRLWAARQQSQPVPMIVADYCGAWDHLELLQTEEDIRSKYHNQPELVEIEQDYMRIDACQKDS